jgi:hypothetical protein
VTSNIPLTIVQGDAVNWSDNWPSYPNGVYSLRYELRGPSTLGVQSATQGFEITPAQSNALSPGVYWWQLYATEIATSKRYTVGQGRLTVAPNLAVAAQPYDGRSQTQKDYEAVVEAIRALVQGGAVQSYSIRGRSLSRYQLSDLMALKAELKRELNVEKAVSGSGGGRLLLINWGHPRR